MSDAWSRIAARLLRATIVVDRAYGLFDRLRARWVLAAASPRTLEAYSELAYSAQSTYLSDQPTSQLGLFRWEERAIDAAFPPAPARVLVGAAGGGREAFALAGRGYDVTAFEPSVDLARSLAAAAPRLERVRAFRASYGDLPVLSPAVDGGAPIDLTRETPFDAAILGWASLSHIATDEARAGTLRWFARLVRGPILVSFFARGGDDRAVRPSSTPVARGAAFTMRIGFYKLIDESDLRALAADAGLRVSRLDLDYLEGWPNAVLVPEEE